MWQSLEIANFFHGARHSLDASRIVEFRVAAASASLPMVCPFAIGKPFGLAAATRNMQDSYTV
jgi:hypothetical protein